MYKLLVADNSVLVREGFRSLLAEIPAYSITEVSESDLLEGVIEKLQPEVLVIDPHALEIDREAISSLKKKFKALEILAITNPLPKEVVAGYLDSGITGFLLKDCDKQEICDAIESTRNGERFLCGKIADVLMGNTEVRAVAAVSKSKKLSCEGFVVSAREVEIIKLIALGMSNKQIADKLCLSLHTVNTHRKNILQKLRVNNTAGVVMFAVKHNLLTDELHAN